MSKGKGMVLEAHLDRLHKLYAAQGRALLFKVPTPVQITGRRAGIKVSAERRPAVWVDYSGTLMGGLAVAIEAKLCTGVERSFPLRNITPHQRQTLSAAHAMGAVSAVYVRGGFLRAIDDYLVPASYIDALAKKSFRWEDVQHFRVPPGKSWLDCMPSHAYDDRENAWCAYADYGWPEHKYCPIDGMGAG